MFCLAFFNLAILIHAQSEKINIIPTKAPESYSPNQLYLKSNFLPWIATIPNISVEYAFMKKWSANIDLMYCPWKLSERFSIKTISIFPEGRFWLKDNKKGSFFNIHFSLAWYNIRFRNYRYQDDGRLLLGGGVGYGYRLPISNRWSMEFTIGAGVASSRYDRYYNVDNGALNDTRSTLYIGLDRAGISIVYNLCDL